MRKLIAITLSGLIPFNVFSQSSGQVSAVSAVNAVSAITADPITKEQLLGQVNAITTTVPFLTITPDSRAGGMGDAGVASSPDANSIHWNPSKLAFVEKKLGFSLTYIPWLRALVNDISLAYLSGYYRLNRRSVAGMSLRYFSLGAIQFTDNAGNALTVYSPNEFALDGAYSTKLSDNFSMGGAARFIYSNLSTGITNGGAVPRPGTSFAVDISGYYRSNEITISDKKSIIAAGLNISNIGTKMSYTGSGVKNFIPINLRLGPSLAMELDDYNSVTFIVDVSKLLVPTPPVYDTDVKTGKQTIVAGKDPFVPVPMGMVQSFYDAPGGFKEELREYILSGGIEYWYGKPRILAIRGGYFHEAATKGNRKYFTAGFGLKYSVFSLDFAYLIPTAQRNPLQNTLRFSLLFDFDSSKSGSSDAVEPPVTN